MNIRQLKKLYLLRLKNIYSNTEICTLFEIFSKEYLNYKKVDILMNLNRELNEVEASKFELAIEELTLGKPYQHILEKTYFCGGEFLVSKDVLIPRPETEELVELALNEIGTTNNKALKILDIGTGSGCIAITLAKSIKNSIVYAVDFSMKALDIAKKNAKIHETEINFMYMDYLTEDIKEISDGCYDIIISNPPYISIEEENSIDRQVKNFEPKMALFAPKENPLAFYKKIAKDAELHLAKSGFIFLEINQTLGHETLKIFAEKFTKTQLLKDLSGNDRFIKITG